MQYRQTDAMARTARERTPFGLRLYNARRAAGLSQVQVFELLQIPQSTLSELETVASSSGYTAQLAALYNIDAHVLATGDAAPPHLHGAESLAQDVSQVAPKITPPTVWEDVMHRDKMEKWPASLAVVVPDQALEPYVMAGDYVTFEACDDAPPKSVVILERPDGTRWIRRLVIRPDGTRWGVTTSDAFPEFPADKVIARATRRSSDFTGF